MGGSTSKAAGLPSNDTDDSSDSGSSSPLESSPATMSCLGTSLQTCSGTTMKSAYCSDLSCAAVETSALSVATGTNHNSQAATTTETGLQEDTTSSSSSPTSSLSAYNVLVPTTRSLSQCQSNSPCPQPVSTPSLEATPDASQTSHQGSLTVDPHSHGCSGTQRSRECTAETKHGIASTACIVKSTQSVPSATPRKKITLDAYIHIFRPKQCTVLGRTAKFIYHSALEFIGVEYSFSSEGMCTGVEHREAWQFVITLDMGTATVDPISVAELITQMNISYECGTYRALTHNCNTFVSDMCLALVGKPAPAWINEPAVKISSLLHLSYFCPVPPTFPDLSLLPLPSREKSDTAVSVVAAEEEAAAAEAVAAAAHPMPSALATCPSPDILLTGCTLPPAVLALADPGDSSHDSPTTAVICPPASVSVLPSLPSVPLWTNLPQDTTANAVDYTIPSTDPLPCSPEHTSSETLPTPEPATVEINPSTPPPQPSASSAPPKKKRGWRNRPECLKCVVPKGFGQSIKSFFCCGGRAGMVKGEA